MTLRCECRSTRKCDQHRARRLPQLNGVDVQEDEIYAKLTTVFHQVFDEEDIVVTPTLSADDVESWDSLRHIRLVMTVEKAFNVKLSAEDLEKMKNIADLVQLVKGKL